MPRKSNDEERLVTQSVRMSARLKHRLKQHAAQTPHKTINNYLHQLILDNVGPAEEDLSPPVEQLEDKIVEDSSAVSADLAAYRDRKWEDIDTSAVSAWMMRYPLDSMWDLKLAGGVEKRNIQLLMVESELIQLNYKGPFKARKVSN